MQRLSGYTRQHVSNLIAQYRDGRPLHPLSRGSQSIFSRKCGAEQVVLPGEMDTLHDNLSLTSG